MFKIRLDSYSRDDQKKILEFQPFGDQKVAPQKFLAIVQQSLENIARQKSKTRSCVDVNLLDDKDREMFMDEMITFGFVPKNDDSFTVIIPDIMVYTNNSVFGSGQIGSFDDVTQKLLNKAFKDISDMRTKIEEVSTKLQQGTPGLE